MITSKDLPTSFSKPVTFRTELGNTVEVFFRGWNGFWVVGHPKLTEFSDSSEACRYLNHWACAVKSTRTLSAEEVQSLSKELA